MAARGRETPEICGVAGCGEEAERSVSSKKFAKTLPNSGLKHESRRLHLCKKHYKDFRKRTREERKLDRVAWRGR